MIAGVFFADAQGRQPDVNFLEDYQSPKFPSIDDFYGHHFKIFQGLKCKAHK